MNDRFDCFSWDKLVSPGINSLHGKSVYLLSKIYQTKIILSDAVLTFGECRESGYLVKRKTSVSENLFHHYTVSLPQLYWFTAQIDPCKSSKSFLIAKLNPIVNILASGQRGEAHPLSLCALFYVYLLHLQIRSVICRSTRVMYQSIPSLTIPPGDPRGFAHSGCPWGRVFAPLSCPGGGGLKSK